MTRTPGPDMPLDGEQAIALYRWLEDTDLFDRDGNPVHYWECPLAPLRAALSDFHRHGGGWVYPEVVEAVTAPNTTVWPPTVGPFEITGATIGDATIGEET